MLIRLLLCALTLMALPACTANRRLPMPEGEVFPLNRTQWMPSAEEMALARSTLR